MSFTFDDLKCSSYYSAMFHLLQNKKFSVSPLMFVNAMLLRKISILSKLHCILGLYNKGCGSLLLGRKGI